MKRTSASQKYWLAFGEFTQMNRDMNMRHETWTWDMNMRYETWTWDMDMGHETWIWDMDMGHETWIWDMNMRHETWTWDMNMRHETWTWGMNTKLKVRVTLHAPVLATFITCSLARSCTTICQLLCLVQRQDELIKEDWLIKMSINGWLNRLALHRYLRLSTHYP